MTNQPLTLHESLNKLHQYTDRQDHEKVKRVNAASWQILNKICEAITPGVKESEIKAYCFELYEKMAVDRIWHQPYIRFGENTVLTFHDSAREDLTLQADDIAFVDIGIVIDGMEGDVGKPWCLVIMPNTMLWQRQRRRFLTKQKLFGEKTQSPE